MSNTLQETQDISEIVNRGLKKDIVLNLCLDFMALSQYCLR